MCGKMKSLSPFTYFPLKNTKEDILKNVGNQTIFFLNILYIPQKKVIDVWNDEGE